MDKIKSNKGKILIKLKFHPITIQKNKIYLVLKNKERERETLIHFISVISDKERQTERLRERERERVKEKRREKLVK